MTDMKCLLARKPCGCIAAACWDDQKKPTYKDDFTKTYEGYGYAIEVVDDPSEFVDQEPCRHEWDGKEPRR
jgi:hypothetical protein